MKAQNYNTQWAVPALLLLILLFNTKGVLEQYMAVSGEAEIAWRWWLNGVALVALDIAVLIFALRGMKRYALLYAMAILLINLRPVALIPDWDVWNVVVDRITLSITRLAFAGGIFIFSEIFAENMKESAVVKRVKSSEVTPVLPQGKKGITPEITPEVTPQIYPKIYPEITPNADSPAEGKWVEAGGKFPIEVVEKLQGKGRKALADRKKYLIKKVRSGSLSENDPELLTIEYVLG